MPTKKNILTFMVDDELGKKLDDYRFENRIGSRSEAIRQLLEKILEISKTTPPTAKVKKPRKRMKK